MHGPPLSPSLLVWLILGPNQAVLLGVLGSTAPDSRVHAGPNPPGLLMVEDFGVFLGHLSAVFGALQSVLSALFENGGGILFESELL